MLGVLHDRGGMVAVRPRVVRCCCSSSSGVCCCCCCCRCCCCCCCLRVFVCSFRLGGGRMLRCCATALDAEHRLGWWWRVVACLKLRACGVHACVCSGTVRPVARARACVLVRRPPFLRHHHGVCVAQSANGLPSSWATSSLGLFLTLPAAVLPGPCPLRGGCLSRRATASGTLYEDGPAWCRRC